VQELATKATERCMELEETLEAAQAELKERNRQIESLSQQVRVPLLRSRLEAVCVCCWVSSSPAVCASTTALPAFSTRCSCWRCYLSLPSPVRARMRRLRACAAQVRASVRVCWWFAPTCAGACARARVGPQTGESIQETTSLNAQVSTLKADLARATAALSAETDAHKESQRELRKLKRCGGGFPPVLTPPPPPREPISLPMPPPTPPHPRSPRPPSPPRLRPCPVRPRLQTSCDWTWRSGTGASKPFCRCVCGDPPPPFFVNRVAGCVGAPWFPSIRSPRRPRVHPCRCSLERVRCAAGAGCRC
jgi:hypothetical protein